jgi:hypothetical protein
LGSSRSEKQLRSGFNKMWKSTGQLAALSQKMKLKLGKTRASQLINRPLTRLNSRKSY